MRVLGEPWRSGFPKSWPDAFSFTKVATKGPFHPSFYFDERPIGYPLLLWSVARSTTVAVVAQTCLYCASFLTLGYVAFRTLRARTAQIFAIILFMLLAVQPRFAEWNTQILSESLSLSLAILMIAAWWWAAVYAPKGVRLAWVATAAWLLTRDGNVAPVLAVVVPVALAVGIWGRTDRTTKRRLLWGAGIAILLSGYVVVSESASDRNRYPLNNNIGLRMLPDADMTDFFVDGGMPMSDALRARTGRDSWSDGPESFLENPELEEYREWAEGPGRRRLLLSLVVEFPWWYDRISDELPQHLKTNLSGYDSFDVRERLPTRPLGPFGSPDSNRSLLIWTGLAVLGLGVALLDRGRRALVIFGAAGLVSAFVDIYVSYTADAVEVGRHLVGPLGRTSVMLISCIAIGVDAFIHWRRHRGDEEPTDEVNEDEIPDDENTGDEIPGDEISRDKPDTEPDDDPVGAQA